jgi:hypothetical protein
VGYGTDPATAGQVERLQRQEDVRFDRIDRHLDTVERAVKSLRNSVEDARDWALVYWLLMVTFFVLAIAVAIVKSNP